MRKWLFTTSSSNSKSKQQGCFIRVYDANDGRLLIEFPINARNGLKYFKTLRTRTRSRKMSEFVNLCRSAGIPDSAVNAAIQYGRKCVVDETGAIV